MGLNEKAGKQTKVHTRILVWYSFSHSPQVQSQLVDLSESGLRLNTAEPFAKGAVLTIQVLFPHLYPEKTTLQCRVTGQKEVIPKVLYHTQVQFVQIEENAKQALFQHLQIQRQTEIKKIVPVQPEPSPQKTFPEEPVKNADHRKHTRVPVTLEAEYIDEIEFSVGSFLIEDLSSGGARVLSDQALPFHKKVVLKIKLSSDTCRIPVQVCWSHEDAAKKKCEMGLSFDPAYVKEIEAVQKHLQTLKKD